MSGCNQRWDVAALLDAEMLKCIHGTENGQWNVPQKFKERRSVGRVLVIIF